MLRKMSVKKKKSHIFSGQHWPFCYELLKDPVITKVGLYDNVTLFSFPSDSRESVS